MQITPLIASTFKTDGGAMFALVPRVIWSRLMTPDQHNRVPQHSNCLMVQLSDGRRGLIETGCGHADNFTAKEKRIHDLSEGWPLADALAKVAIEPCQIDFVILTHLHWDHAGGTGSSDMQGAPVTLTFNRAVHYIHAQEWRDAIGANPLLYQSYPPAVLAPLRSNRDKLKLIEGTTSPILPGITMIRTGGHTRGHCILLLKDDQLVVHHPDAHPADDYRTIIFAGDLCPTQHHLRLVYQTAYDTHPLDTRAWKQQWLPKIADQGDLLFFAHDPQLFGATLRANGPKERVIIDKVIVAP